jgi:hypothetical protein
LNGLVDLCEILYEGDDVEDDSNTMLLNPIASSFPKWRTFELLEWMHLLYGLMVLDKL